MHPAGYSNQIHMYNNSQPKDHTNQHVDQGPQTKPKPKANSNNARFKIYDNDSTVEILKADEKNKKNEFPAIKHMARNAGSSKEAGEHLIRQTVECQTNFDEYKLKPKSIFQIDSARSNHQPCPGILHIKGHPEIFLSDANKKSAKEREPSETQRESEFSRQCKQWLNQTAEQTSGPTVVDKFKKVEYKYLKKSKQNTPNMRMQHQTKKSDANEIRGEIKHECIGLHPSYKSSVTEKTATMIAPHQIENRHSFRAEERNLSSRSGKTAPRQNLSYLSVTQGQDRTIAYKSNTSIEHSPNLLRGKTPNDRSTWPTKHPNVLPPNSAFINPTAPQTRFSMKPNVGPINNYQFPCHDSNNSNYMKPRARVMTLHQSKETTNNQGGLDTSAHSQKIMLSSNKHGSKFSAIKNVNNQGAKMQCNQTFVQPHEMRFGKHFPKQLPKDVNQIEHVPLPCKPPLKFENGENTNTETKKSCKINVARTCQGGNGNIYNNNETDGKRAQVFQPITPISPLRTNANNKARVNKKQPVQSDNDKIEVIRGIAVTGCTQAEGIALQHQTRPCFKNIHHLCTRTKSDVQKSDCTLANLSSQGIPWATKDFIFAFIRMANSWVIMKGYLTSQHDNLSKIERCFSHGMRDSFVKWQELSKEMMGHLIETFRNLENENLRQRYAYQCNKKHNNHKNNAKSGNSPREGRPTTCIQSNKNIKFTNETTTNVGEGTKNLYSTAVKSKVPCPPKQKNPKPNKFFINLNGELSALKNQIKDGELTIIDKNRNKPNTPMNFNIGSTAQKNIFENTKPTYICDSVNNDAWVKFCTDNLKKNELNHKFNDVHEERTYKGQYTEDASSTGNTNVNLMKLNAMTSNCASPTSDKSACGTGTKISTPTNKKRRASNPYSFWTSSTPNLSDSSSLQEVASPEMYSLFPNTPRYDFQFDIRASRKALCESPRGVGAGASDANKNAPFGVAGASAESEARKATTLPVSSIFTSAAAAHKPVDMTRTNTEEVIQDTDVSLKVSGLESATKEYNKMDIFGKDFHSRHQYGNIIAVEGSTESSKSRSNLSSYYANPWRVDIDRADPFKRYDQLWSQDMNKIEQSLTPNVHVYKSQDFFYNKPIPNISSAEEKWKLSPRTDLKISASTNATAGPSAPTLEPVAAPTNSKMQHKIKKKNRRCK